MKRIHYYNAAYLLSSLMLMVTSFTYIAPRFGWHVDTVATNTTGAPLKKGALAVTRSVDLGSIVIGDIIIFSVSADSNTLVTHRVASIEKGSLFHFITEGKWEEANTGVSIQERNLYRKLILHIPLLGYVIQFLKSIPGYIVGIIIPFIILAMFYLNSIKKVIHLRRMSKGRIVQ